MIIKEFAILLLLFPFFFLGGPGSHASRSYVIVWDLGHIVFFSIFTVILLKKLRQYWQVNLILSLYLILFFVVLLAGILIECLQVVIDGRLADVYDLMRNQMGWFAGVTFFSVKHQIFSCKILQWMRVLLFIASGFVLYPLIIALTDESIGRLQFPVLSDFETPFERDRWHSDGEICVQNEILRHGRRAMWVKLTTDTYPGVSMKYFPGNWQKYQQLTFSVFNPEMESFKLVCRIHDEQHNNDYSDRFNRLFLLMPGWNDFVIPLDDVKHALEKRDMDMSRIRNIKLFVVRQEKKRVIYVDNIRLSMM